MYHSVKCALIFASFAIIANFLGGCFNFPIPCRLFESVAKSCMHKQPPVAPTREETMNNALLMICFLKLKLHCIFSVFIFYFAVCSIPDGALLYDFILINYVSKLDVLRISSQVIIIIIMTVSYLLMNYIIVLCGSPAGSLGGGSLITPSFHK